MLKVWIATLLNFFLPGAGYLVLGHRVGLSLLWLAGVIGLTWVELSIQSVAPQSYTVMFASVFVMNTAFAIDAWLIGRAGVGEPSAVPA
ncbi:MAG: hypothetical protein KTR31_03980 [Myxococcales bacterium]|nr:hypothetical protein [Myxococcales bacterium]